MKKEIPEKNYLIISKVVKKLRKLYPDLTNSKLRFLESEGLLSPKRALNRYRIYYREDIEKLNYILKMQKDFYMPLEVIKEKLKSKEFKKFISECESIETLQLKLGEEFKPGYELKLYSIDDISKKFKLSQSFIIDLHENEIIDWSEENGKYVVSTYDIEILKLASKLSKYGIQVRHLKLFENFAGRHSSFIQQIIYPLLMSSKKDSHVKAARVANKLERILCDFQELLIKKENRKFLEKYK
ncbi:putative HTH-type transcriptional regulator [subsurface metagenome]|nr:MerR family transcriptional regulator [Clostridia bacterium]